MLKKITDIIVDKRYIVIAVVLIITAGCAFLLPKVNINTDMTKYLPDDSNMKQGIDIMAKDFPDIEENSTIRVMFRDLTDEQKPEMKQKLEHIKNVDSVDYEADSSSYNKKNCTLYIVNTQYDYGSTEETRIEKTLEEDFAKYKMEYKNDDTGGTDLPVWVMLVAVALLMVILFAMCGSWFEPILFLLTIGIAVIINLGTNYFLESVSDTTYAIAAILQLTLSMDYSIILMNRYRQERRLNDSPTEAMKLALRKAFVSITSSSVTTIVGLLVLTLMSFKIGMDLGVVLAKGVLMSLICILLMLPGEILIFDKVIQKTAKKVLPIRLHKLAHFEHRFRYVIAGAFVVLFVGLYFLSGRTEMAYTLAEEDPIADVFPKSNPVVMLYETKGNSEDAALADKIAEEKGVESVTCFSNTLGKKYTAPQLADEIQNMDTEEAEPAAAGDESGGTMELDASMLSMIYYDYYKDGKLPTLTMSRFLTFLSDEVAENETFSDQLDASMKENLKTMKKFADKKSLTSAKNSKQLAGFFGMSSDQVSQLMLYRSIQSGTKATNKMTLPAFVDFLQNDVAKNKTYASSFDKKTMAQIKSLSVYTKKDSIQKQRTADEMAQTLGMDAAQTAQIYQVYQMMNNPQAGGSQDAAEGSAAASQPQTLSLKQFTDFLLSNQQLSGSLDQQTKAQLTQLQKLMETSLQGETMNASQMAQVLGMTASQTNQIYLLNMYETGQSGAWKMSPQKFIHFLLSDVASSKQFSGQFDASTRTQLTSAQTIIDAVVSGKSYTAEQMRSLLQGMSDELDQTKLELLYLYYGGLHESDPDWKMSIYDLFQFLKNDLLQDARFTEVIPDGSRTQILDAGVQIEDGAKQLVGRKYSRMIINTTLPEESTETTAFIHQLHKLSKEDLKGTTYLVGSSAMNDEMQKTFSHEMNMITLITALAIFAVVAIAFRSLLIPLVLVLLVQCGVYATVSIVGLQGYSIYYLALLIVECILMGATIDYAILFTNYYRENSEVFGPREALKRAYDGSIHTIMTSGLIMVVVTGIVGYCFENPTLGQICQTISIGALCAILLILFVLPAVLTVLDRFIVRRKTRKADPKASEQS